MVLFFTVFIIGISIILIFSLYNKEVTLAVFSTMIPLLIFLLPELSINESDNSQYYIFLLIYIFFLPAIDALAVCQLYGNGVYAISVFMVVLVLMFALVILKAIIFGETEIGKVSTIYIEEYRELQGPQLSIKRFWEYFSFHKKSKQTENTDS